MGGEGSTQHIIVTMRNNLDMLRRKSMFKREHSFFKTRKEYYKASKGEIVTKKLSKEELLFLRIKVIQKRREDDIKSLIILIAIVVLIIVLGIYISIE